MNLLLLGVSHHTAPVDLREKLDFASGDVGAAAQELAVRASVPECVVLSTCNRSEIYVSSSEPHRTREDIIAFLGKKLIETGRDRPRGLALIREARTGLAAIGRTDSVADLDAWLKQHAR